MSKPVLIDATVANAGTESGEVELNGLVPVGVYVPAGAEGVTLTFNASASEGGAKAPIKDIAGVAYSVTIGATAAYYPLGGAVFKGVHFITLVVAAQTGAIVFQLSCRPAVEA
jgi:hypothetical protein